MNRVRVRPAVLSTVLIALLIATLAVPGPARATEPTGAQFVLTALGTLRDHYVDPLPAPRLLNAALATLRTQLRVSPFGGPIPDNAADTEAATLFTQRFNEIVSQVFSQHSATELGFLAAGGMLESLHDSHTSLIAPAMYQEVRRRESGQAAFTGIGILLVSRDGQFYVNEVYPGGPAAAAGVRTFDRVLAVNGKTTNGLKEDDVSSMIRGPAGTRIVLTLGRPGSEQPVELAMTRGPIMVPGVASKMLNGDIGYLRLYEFLPRTSSDFRDAIFALRQSGMKALVLDLRGNPGGLVDELREIAGTLLPVSSPILQMRTRGGRGVMVQTASPPILSASIPIAVLVDDETGSAAELLAAALQEQSRAVITGVKTAGAVEIGITVGLPQGAGMSVTVARVLTGKGVRLEGHGVTPDISENLTTSSMNVGRDSQLDRAVDLIRKTLGGKMGAQIERQTGGQTDLTLLRPVPSVLGDAA